MALERLSSLFSKEVTFKFDDFHLSRLFKIAGCYVIVLRCIATPIMFCPLNVGT